MPTKTLFVLAEFSLALGLIDISEYAERRNIARWLADDDVSSIDPRESNPGEVEEAARTDERVPLDRETVRLLGTGRVNDPDWLAFVVLNKWYFTRSDPDPYPSTLHGHLQSASRPWPKLNPYTGRAFKAKHQEEASLRLTKHEMRELWQTEAFRDFCRSHILWYSEAHPHYAFNVSHPLRFPRW